MGTRHDVSAVQPQGGYIAKQCPVRAQLNVLQPGIPIEPDEFAQLIMRQGREFETDVLAELDGHAPTTGWVFVAPDLPRREAIAETVAAMSESAELIASGWLPVDEKGRRTGRPDLLIRHGDGYVAVDVKHHRTLDVSEEGTATASALDAPFLDAAKPEVGWLLRKRKDDALQLAHYRRMLEACGFGSEGSIAGIIGKERVVVWYDLDVPMWQTPAKSDGRKRKMRTTMEVYDFEFDFRLDIAAIAHLHRADSSVELLVLPVRRSECGSCPWLDVCNVELEAGSGDPSLLSPVRFDQWRTLREVEITDRDGVANLHYPTAKLSAAGVNVTRLISAASTADLDAPIDDLLSGAPKQLTIARAAGLEIAADVLEQVDPHTGSLGGGDWLPAAIISARAVLGLAPVYRKPGRVAVLPPRADIEVDIDMENTNDGVYLWGALVNDRTNLAPVADGYYPFATWDPLSEESELVVFRQFWDWLSSIREQARQRGATVAGYCWHEQAENTQMRRIAAADASLAAEVDEFIDSDQWVDLMKVYGRSWTSGGSIGLKAVAPLADFDWPVADPGGGTSMVYHARLVDQATSEEDRKQLQDWLLDYNRGDVEATLAIREWLSEDGMHLPIVPAD